MIVVSATAAIVFAAAVTVVLVAFAVAILALKRRADRSDHRHALCSHRAASLWEVLPEQSKREWSPREDAYEDSVNSVE